MKCDIEFPSNATSFNVGFGEVYDLSNDNTYLLVTPDGREIPAVLVSEETVFDATPNDIRIGKLAATDDGVTTGEKIIPSYHTVTGTKLIRPNARLVITNPSTAVDNYDYTELQVIICLFNTSSSNSVAAEQVCIGDTVYNVRSVEALSTVSKNHENKTIDLGLINESGKPNIIRYFTYKEID